MSNPVIDPFVGFSDKGCETMKDYKHLAREDRPSTLDDILDTLVCVAAGLAGLWILLILALGIG